MSSGNKLLILFSLCVSFLGLSALGHSPPERPKIGCAFVVFRDEIRVFAQSHIPLITERCHLGILITTYSNESIRLQIQFPELTIIRVDAAEHRAYTWAMLAEAIREFLLIQNHSHLAVDWYMISNIDITETQLDTFVRSLHASEGQSTSDRMVAGCKLTGTVDHQDPAIPYFPISRGFALNSNAVHELADALKKQRGLNVSFEPGMGIAYLVRDFGLQQFELCNAHSVSIAEL